MFHHPSLAVGSYSCSPPSGGNSPNLSQQNLVPDHLGHAVPTYQVEWNPLDRMRQLYSGYWPIQQSSMLIRTVFSQFPPTNIHSTKFSPDERQPIPKYKSMRTVSSMLSSNQTTGWDHSGPKNIFCSDPRARLPIVEIKQWMLKTLNSANVKSKSIMIHAVCARWWRW